MDEPTETTLDTGDADGGELGGSAPGARFGRFVVLGALGAGGMGVVMSAFDPELDRKVALKLLHPRSGAGVEARARLQREAQAMARLAHPNAVTVFDVGRAGEHLFIAMELVDGTTLRAWLAEGRRPWRDVLAMFVGAGRGLEAAHAAALVHRDFKPENVLIGRDGRPRVSDFGLAESGLAPDDDAIAAAITGASLDVGGLAVGTPSYMAPEQWLGHELDARTDQFAFCVALWTALWGQPPFAGDNVAELREAVIAGQRRPAPPATDAPGWLAPILDRGLAIDGDARWPSMTALLGALERGAAGRRRWWIGAGAAAIVLGGAGLALALTRDARAPAAEPCPAPTARVDAIWGPARRDAMSQHLAAIDPSTGPLRFAAAAAVLDRGAAAWTAMHVATCRATRVEGRQSDSALDARMHCLDGWLEGLGAAVAGLAQAADPGALEGAVKSVGSIGSVDRCTDVTALLAAAEQPASPEGRAEAAAILAEVKAINGERKASHFDGLGDRADALLVRARALGHIGSLDKALAVRWRVAFTGGDVPGALRFMRELTEVAARGHDDVEAANTWALMGRLTAQFQGQPDEAKVMMAAARAAAARAGNPPLVLAEVLGDTADVLTAAGDAAGARAAIAEAHHLLEAAGADQPGSPDAPALAALLQTEGEAAWDAGDHDAAVAALRRAVALLDRAYGPDTVEAAGDYLDLAQVLHAQHHDDDALVAVDQSIRIRALRGGESPPLAIALSTRTAIVGALGRAAASIADGERALRIGRATMPEDDAALLAITAEAAGAYARAGRLADALALYVELLASAERAAIVTSNVATWWIERADLERRLGRCNVALPHYARAGQIATEATGADSEQIARAAGGAAACRR